MKFLRQLFRKREEQQKQEPTLAPAAKPTQQRKRQVKAKIEPPKPPPLVYDLATIEPHLKNRRAFSTLDFICPTCGDVFSRAVHYVKNRHVKSGQPRIFCSGECAGLWMSKPMHNVPCASCGAPVMRKTLRAGMRVFCNQSCAAKFNNQVAPKRKPPKAAKHAIGVSSYVCAFCAKPFQRYAVTVRVKAPCCSKSCARKLNWRNGSKS